jgi:hypothetical protein
MRPTTGPHCALGVTCGVAERDAVKCGIIGARPIDELMIVVGAASCLLSTNMQPRHGNLPDPNLYVRPECNDDMYGPVASWPDKAIAASNIQH